MQFLPQLQCEAEQDLDQFCHWAKVGSTKLCVLEVDYKRKAECGFFSKKWLAVRLVNFDLQQKREYRRCNMKKKEKIDVLCMPWAGDCLQSRNYTTKIKALASSDTVLQVKRVMSCVRRRKKSYGKTKGQQGEPVSAKIKTENRERTDVALIKAFVCLKSQLESAS